MEWIVIFIVSWLLFIFLVDLKQIKVNIWSGLLAAILQLSVDTQAMSHKLYKINEPVINVFGSSLFFMLGPVLVIALLLAQFHPEKRWMTVLNVFILSGLYSLQELFLISRESLVYTNWHIIDSITVNTVVMAVLSWFSIIILDKTWGVRK